MILKLKVWLLKKLLNDVSKHGHDGDVYLAHINKFEHKLLKAVGGEGSLNTDTGLVQYKGGGGGGNSQTTNELDPNVVPYVTDFKYLNKSYGNITSSMKASTNTYPIALGSVGFDINKEFTSNNYDYYYNEITYNVQLSNSNIIESDGVILLRISELKKGGNGDQNDLSFPNFISSIEVTRN